MPIKPLSHLRPLLRLPTHPTPPTEHFTANPSLLHHLPQSQGSHAHALATHGATAASSGGHGAGTGRSGFNAGGAGNHGYTGHARAFLSLPQTVSLDPTASLTYDDNNPSSQRRNSILLRHRLASRSQTQIIQIPEDGPRRVRKSIEARTGSGKVGIVEIDGQGLGELEHHAQAQAIRGSIVFPSITNVRPEVRGPTRGLMRTRSTMDFGIHQSHKDIHIPVWASEAYPLDQIPFPYPKLSLARGCTRKRSKRMRFSSV